MIFKFFLQSRNMACFLAVGYRVTTDFLLNANAFTFNNLTMGQDNMLLLTGQR